MLRRFVNVVAENFKTGVYSLHRIDVSKHLFHQSRADARVVPPFLGAPPQDDDRSCDDEQPMVLDRLKELPAAMATWSSSNVDYFSLFRSCCEDKGEGGILCMNKVGTAVLYDPQSSIHFIMPGVNKLKGHVPVSVSVVPAAAGGDREEEEEEEEELYIMHGGPDPDGLELDLNPDEYRFDVLRFGPPWLGSMKSWSWQSLPVPPFVNDPLHVYKRNLISAYTVVDGGNTICVSSVAKGVGTYYLNTANCETKRAGDHDFELPYTGKATCEWKRAGDWVLPFAGKAEYISDLNLWLGFSLRSPGYLCAAPAISVSDVPLMDHEPTMSSPVFWPDNSTPKEWVAVNAKLLSLGLGKFAIAKVFKAVTVREPAGSDERGDTVEDQVLVLSGVELEELKGEEDDDNKNDLQGRLKLFQHKAICYTCANSTGIHCVL